MDRTKPLTSLQRGAKGQSYTFKSQLRGIDLKPLTLNRPMALAKPLKLFLVLAALFFVAGFASAGQSSHLTTPSYIIAITENCAEGDVGCSNVTYVGRNRKSQQSTTLKGKAIMHMCPDRVTPCSHQGYAFKNGNAVYRLTPDGALVVLRHGKVVLAEQGTWSW